MQKLTPFLWFEKDLKGITDFYSSVFPGTKVKSNGRLNDTPSGDVEMAGINILGLELSLMAAGPQYTFKPSVSFMVLCESIEEVEIYWHKLIESGRALMDISEYPFAKRFGWVEDKYKVNWQLIYREPDSAAVVTQKIIPALMFSGEGIGRAEEALDFYVKTFHDSKKNSVELYEPGETSEPKARVKHARFVIEGVQFAMMDGNGNFDFEQAVSFMVLCNNQAEVDFFWNALTADGGKEIQCGWLTDKFGVPWQVVPSAFEKCMREGTSEQIARVQKAFMKMKKFEISTLEKAYNGEENLVQPFSSLI